MCIRYACRVSGDVKALYLSDIIYLMEVLHFKTIIIVVAFNKTILGGVYAQFFFKFIFGGQIKQLSLQNIPTKINFLSKKLFNSNCLLKFFYLKSQSLKKKINIIITVFSFHSNSKIYDIFQFGVFLKFPLLQTHFLTCQWLKSYLQ